MFTPAIVSYVRQFYPLGNMPAVSLTRSLPQGLDADILLLGYGDVRNVLYTADSEREFPSRRLDITCCDIDTNIIARNAILFTLHIDGVSADVAMDIYYHFYISETSIKVLKEQANKLLSLASSIDEWNKGQYGSLVSFCGGGSLHRVKQVWAKYASPPSESRSKAAFEQDLRSTQEYKMESSGAGGTSLTLTGIRSASPLAIAAMLEVPKVYDHYWKHGMFSKHPASEVNPMFAEALSANAYLHHSTDPILGFHLATAFARLAPTSPLRPSPARGGE